MKNTPSTFLLLLLTLFVSSTMLHAQDWELKRDKGGIKVYVRDQPGTAIKELKFTTTVEASMQTIAAVLTHVEGFDDWVYASLKSRTIKQVSEGEVYYYTLIDFPWPLSNRDLVLHSTVWQDKKTLALHSKTTSCHWMETEKEDVVRIKKAELIWIFTPLDNGKVRVDYTLNSDPGGSIPAWMINLAADQGPLQSMIKFQEMLEREKYKNTRLAFVVNAK
ncbi:MAG: hypothetical protein IPM82_12615 [Saprospiraceae bacterium]|nr:hypothetical protein [Saprospiraceae bacterium]